ncbi:MAG: DUF4125 family protein [Acidobacteria bacterium]|nr:DUF4125 family protein [Acidobacteriota bacterium]
MTEDRCNELMDQIIRLEWDMFSRVRTLEPAECQERGGTFRVMRRMHHSVMPEAVLESYLDDLRQANIRGRNLMTEKYARMQKLMPPLSINPLIPKIVDIEAEWMRDLADRFPATFQSAILNFVNYASCELETYSDRTLFLYHDMVVEARRQDRNLAEERYSYLFRKMGYDSIAEREEKHKADPAVE